MKQLSELGISPAPWKAGDAISKSDGTEVVTSINSAGDSPVFKEGDLWIKVADARLIASAPKMYEALRQSTNMIEHSIQFIKNRDIKIALQKLADDNKAALAEVAGESEVKR